jgi:FkbM family methyltransferase
MHLIDKILSREEFQTQPPVLLDIGASGGIHFRWKRIARHCVCIAFDPDDREYGYIEKEQGNYKKLYVFNCVVSDTTTGARPFYLTKSPYCSSFLRPLTGKLAPYAYAEKFTVEKELQLPVRSLPDVMKELGLTYLDWFKTDAQGMDLRIFRSLGEEVIGRVKVAEFEPGILDAYEGEDKLHQVLAFMESRPFFLSDFKVKGASRVSPENIRSLTGNPFMQKLLAVSHKKMAGWGELLFLGTFEGVEKMSLRDYLLTGVLAILNQEYGFALEIAQKAARLYEDPIIAELDRYARRGIWRSVLKLRFMADVWKRISKA